MPATVLVNLTVHDVVVELDADQQKSLRVADPDHPDDRQAAWEVPLAAGEPPLPEPRPDTVYVTSRVVAEHFPERADLAWSDDLVRDEHGEVVAAHSLACLHPMTRAD